MVKLFIRIQQQLQDHSFEYKSLHEAIAALNEVEQPWYIISAIVLEEKRTLDLKYNGFHWEVHDILFSEDEEEEEF